MDERYLNNSYEEEYDEYDDENRYDDNDDVIDNSNMYFHN